MYVVDKGIYEKYNAFVVKDAFQNRDQPIRRVGLCY